ncbi:uncharacterized protein LOC135468221 [Liolophura sinensis]|uniref:uncharacterized protein LOC135468221 n=1 Tax=Liolophura sinensis TaxID=3198878 RepID=UPI0031593A2B
MAEEILKLICSSAKLERDRGVAELQRFIATLDGPGIQELEQRFLQLLGDTSAEWEKKHGALMGAKAVLVLQVSSDDFSSVMGEKAISLLDDGEFRVRIAAGEVMGALCSRVGPEIYGLYKDVILQGVRSNLERDLSLLEPMTSSQEDTEKLVEKLGNLADRKRRNSADAAQIFHDTAGWKALETWMKCLQSMIDGCGHLFNPHVDQDLLDLIFQALNHTNRFVRETGYYVCASLVSCGIDHNAPDGVVAIDESNAVYRYGHQFTEYLGKGLSDNWSQVRLAASIATRKFLQSLPSDEIRGQFYPVLIPRMCLNRYYVAEGVKIFSQETWRQITQGEGKQLVERYMPQVVEYYIEQSEADNHAVREAACACIAELGHKLDKSVVSPYIPKLLDALIVCFNDDSWPVRDAACVACGNFVQCFPQESKDSMPTLYPLFFNNLQDNIPSVRQGAALALANVLKAYGDESAKIVIAKIKEGLEGVASQPVTAEKYGDLEKGPATYGVVKRARDNDMDLHTDKQMYSCGSLAPKMGRGKRGGGCMDHKFRKPPEPWELADGCVHLVSEIANIPQYSSVLTELLPLVAQAASHKHYTQHFQLLESICKQLPSIARGLGKRPFKQFIEFFLNPVFYALTSDNALTSSAASQCLNQLSSFLGPNILRGRVEQYNPRYLEQLDANQFIAPL